MQDMHGLSATLSGTEVSASSFGVFLLTKIGPVQPRVSTSNFPAEPNGPNQIQPTRVDLRVCSDGMIPFEISYCR